MALTDLKIRNLKPKEKPYKVTDEKSMYVVKSPNGATHFYFKYL